MLLMLVEHFSGNVVYTASILEVRNRELVCKKILFESLAIFLGTDLFDLGIFRSDVLRADVGYCTEALEV